MFGGGWAPCGLIGIAYTAEPASALELSMRRAPVLQDTFFARRLDGDAGNVQLIVGGAIEAADCSRRLYASRRTARRR